MIYLKSSKKREEGENKELQKNVTEIIESVRKNGDVTLRELNLKFDESKRKKLRISEDEIKEAYSLVSEEEIQDIKKAAANIEKFAKLQRETVKELKEVEMAPGLILGHKIIPIDSCCCYVPGGGYPLYSTALMLGIPAKVAGVKRVAACSPTMKGTGKIHPKTLVAMNEAGIDEIYAMGGAGAVAAFSYGTEEIKEVDIIVGPGNSYVTEAKRQCYGKIGIDFVAGPSEVLIVADENAEADIIAADILAQSEHDREAKGILITTSKDLGEKVILAVEEQLKTLETGEIAKISWDNYGEVILVDNLDEAVEYSNKYAPEHLEVNLKEEDLDCTIEKLRNYGSLFIGEYTAEVFGDYASGTNHTLPTVGAARYTGGVWVGTFLKTCTYQKLNKSAMLDLAPLVSNLARGEGLIGHGRAAEIRMEKFGK